MKQIKIKFSGMGGRFNPEKNFITDILKNHYNVVLSERPDYLFFSVNSKDYMDYDCIRIFYTAENLVPDFNICDYAIGFHYMDFGDRYIRFPLYLVDGFRAYADDDYASDLKYAMHKHENVEKTLSQKSGFCAFVYSNAEAATCREKIYDELTKYKKVNSGGRYLNNIGGAVDNKRDFQLKHKFVIAFENTSTPGYTTEKIVHAFSANAIPIYWGNPEIEKEFNSNAFINCHMYGLTEKGESQSINAIVDNIKRIDENEDMYIRMLKAPAFIDDGYVQKTKNDFEKFLCNIFDQEKEKAYRRNRFYWGERYERKQKIGNKFYWMCRKAIPVRDALKKITARNKR